MSARAIPPIADLSSRIRNMAYLYGLQEGVADELGSFMSIALEVSQTDPADQNVADFCAANTVSYERSHIICH